MKKVLLIGFHKYDDSMYPHLRCFIDQLSKHCAIDYFHFRERGYFIENVITKPFRPQSYVRVFLSIIYTIIDSLRLKLRTGEYDKVIAIDHYAYALASFIFRKKKVILWSYDVISYDSIIYNNFFVRGFMKLCSRALARNGRVIIQDEERLNLLKESLHMDDYELDVFYMPVCLERTSVTKRELSSTVRPRLMQSGGIGAYRSSDKLLSHYQKNFDSYRLYFHGIIFGEIKDQLARCDAQPMVSSRTVNPKLIYQLSDYCDIGFVCYEDEDDLNFSLIARASGQLVEFLRVGMPVIVMGKNNLPQFVEEQGIGVSIKDMSEMNPAIKTIVQNFEHYSHNCFRSFDLFFDCEIYIPRILNWIGADK